MTQQRHFGLTALLVAVAGAALAVTIFLDRTPSRSPARVMGSPRAFALTFSRAYVRFLQGRLSVNALPGSSSRVRDIAVSAPGRISGSVVLRSTSLRYVSGSKDAQAVVSARAGGRAMPFDLGLTFVNGHWQVTYLVPPDIGTALAANRHAAQTTPQMRRAATRFALAYTDYRESATHTPPAALPALKAQIAAGDDPLAQITPDRSAAQLRLLSFAPPQGDLVAVSATLSDRGNRRSYTFVMRYAGESWQAWQFAQGTTG